MVACCAAIVLIAAGALGGVLAFGGGDTEPLPAASGPAVKPRKGQTRAGAVYASASPAVVSIKTGSGAGTGFLIDRDGRSSRMPTWSARSDRVEVRFGTDSTRSTAQVRGTDPSSDLAVVRDRSTGSCPPA